MLKSIFVKRTCNKYIQIVSSINQSFYLGNGLRLDPIDVYIRETGRDGGFYKISQDTKDLEFEIDMENEKDSNGLNEVSICSRLPSMNSLKIYNVQNNDKNIKYFLENVAPRHQKIFTFYGRVEDKEERIDTLKFYLQALYNVCGSTTELAEFGDW